MCNTKRLQNRRLLVVVARLGRLVCVRPLRAPPRGACTCGPAMGGGRDARKAEAAVKKKLIADAAVVLGKIEAAQSAEALAAAIKEAKPFSSVASIQQAIPAATQRLATLKAQADKATTRDFLSRVEEAERRDMKHPSAKNKAEEQLKRYFEEFFQEGGRRRGAEKTWCVAAPYGSGLGSEGMGCKGSGRLSAPRTARPYLRCAGTSRSLRRRWTSSHRVSAARTSRPPSPLPYAAAAPEPPERD